MRTVRVRGVSLVGTEADLITVEARFERVDRTRTEVVLSGLPDPVIRESRGRLLSALEANGLHLPQGRLFLNLTPAGVRKTGEALDLPLALAAAAAGGHFTPGALVGALFVGELGIDGRLHPVPGGLAAAEAAERGRLPCLVAPPATAREAAFWPGARVFEAADLKAVVAWVATREGLRAVEPPGEPPLDAPAFRRSAARALDPVRGQATAKRALVVAAAGGHGLLFFGPPGTGKSTLARALVALLPPPTPDERLAITRVLSAAGRFGGGIARTRPFRAPHHTASFAGLVGGGNPVAPGEITLAHGGVLFLDELPEFRREALEALRQPLESGVVTLARAGRHVELPARFQLICAMNPCPCGYRGHPTVVCRCSPAEVWRYRRRVSGPLLDRVDLRVELVQPRADELLRVESGEVSGARLWDDVQRACTRMRARQGERTNAALPADALADEATLEPEARRLLERVTERQSLSARAVQSVRRVARSLADLDDGADVAERHVAEAVALRAPVR